MQKDRQQHIEQFMLNLEASRRVRAQQMNLEKNEANEPPRAIIEMSKTSEALENRSKQLKAESDVFNAQVALKKYQEKQ